MSASVTRLDEISPLLWFFSVWQKCNPTFAIFMPLGKFQTSKWQNFDIFYQTIWSHWNILKICHSRPFSVFWPFPQLPVDEFMKIFADDRIRTADLWFWKQLLWQRSHNHCPIWSHCNLMHRNAFRSKTQNGSFNEKMENKNILEARPFRGKDFAKKLFLKNCTVDFNR